MSIRAGVFDFGGVVIRTLFEMARGLEGWLGLPPGSIDISGPFDPSADPLWRRFRAGEYSELEYWRRRADLRARRGGPGCRRSEAGVGKQRPVLILIARTQFLRL